MKRLLQSNRNLKVLLLALVAFGATAIGITLYATGVLDSLEGNTVDARFSTRGTQAGEFFRGIFRVEQNQANGGLVDLVIRDNVSEAVCGSGAAHDAALSQRVLGLLRGVAKGRFRTVGRFAAASVRGTNWGVRDRCDGTLTVVRTGVVIVRDFRLKRNIVVRAGQTYLAKAP